MKKIFVTGISGCVGHYLFDVLKNHQDYKFYFLVRNPDKLRFDLNTFPNATLIHDDLGKIEKYAALLKETNYLIHLAAQWGGSKLNYDFTLLLFNLLDPDRCEKVIYFSTASILGPDNRPSKDADRFGRLYIKSKYQFFQKLPELKIYPRVTTLFPTWVLGGDERHPYSHASSGILKLRRWLWLLKFFTVDLSFHFIHARDISLIVDHLLKNNLKEKEFVLGNPAISAEEFIRKTCRFFNQPASFKIAIPLSLVKAFDFLGGGRLHSWDRYCLDKKHFVYDTVNAASFGIKSDLENIEQILADAFQPSHEKI